MGKNLLSDTDYTKGRDNRFGVTAVVGKVTQIEVNEKGANVRVIMPDRLDHQDQPLISKPIPVMQIASKAKKSFAVPRLNDNVLLVKLPNGTSNYAVIGSFYTTKDPPPVTDPMLDYVIFDDGSTMQFNASTGELTWKLKGKMTWDNEKGADLKFKELISVKSTEGNIEIESSSGNITIKAPSGTILLDQQTVHLKGTLIFEGNIQHTGNMTTSGVHQDSLGFHTGGTSNTETWKWTVSTSAASADGQVGINAASWAAATTVNINVMSDSPRDMTLAMNAVAVGDELYVQQSDDSNNFSHYSVTGAAIDHGTWREYPVELINAGGTLPGNNQATSVTLVKRYTPPSALRITALEQRIAQLEALHHG